MKPQLPDRCAGEDLGAIEPKRADLRGYGTRETVVVRVDDGLGGPAKQITWELVEQDGKGQRAMGMDGETTDGERLACWLAKMGDEGGGNLVIEVSVRFQTLEWREDVLFGTDGGNGLGGKSVDLLVCWR